MISNCALISYQNSNTLIVSKGISSATAPIWNKQHQIISMSQSKSRLKTGKVTVFTLNQKMISKTQILNSKIINTALAIEVISSTWRRLKTCEAVAQAHCRNFTFPTCWANLVKSIQNKRWKTSSDAHLFYLDFCLFVFKWGLELLLGLFMK